MMQMEVGAKIMKRTYKVIFTKYETYYVLAENLDEAENKGFDILDNDKTAFMFDPVDKVEVKELDNIIICPECDNMFFRSEKSCPECGWSEDNV